MSTVQGIGSDAYSLFAKTTKTSKSSGLDFNDFLVLIAAQLSNQDMFNPVNDTEFMGQMAQFASLQAMQTLTTMNATTYSVGLLGKEITTARMDSTGQLIVNTGVVTGVGLFDGDPIVYIGNEKYSLGEIMVVGKMPEAQAPTEEDKTDPVDPVETDPETQPEVDPENDPYADRNYELGI